MVKSNLSHYAHISAQVKLDAVTPKRGACHAGIHNILSLTPSHHREDLAEITCQNEELASHDNVVCTHYVA